MSQQYPPQYTPWPPAGQQEGQQIPVQPVPPAAPMPPAPQMEPAQPQSFPPPPSPYVQEQFAAADDGYQPPLSPPPPTRFRRGAAVIVITVLVLLGVGFILRAGVFRIKHVQVEGDYILKSAADLETKRVLWAGKHAVSQSEVISAAGLDGKVGYFSLNEEKIKEGIASHRYLIYQGMDAVFPNSVTLYVQVRQACADVQVMGISYRMDAEGMVLERDGAVGPSGDRVVITGLQPREIRVGQKIAAINPSQLSAYMRVMEELLLQQWLDEASELNVTDPQSLYLITRDGYTVHLGDESQMQAKIGTVRAVVDQLRRDGKKGGVIEAQTPGVATFSPSNL